MNTRLGDDEVHCDVVGLGMNGGEPRFRIYADRDRLSRQRGKLSVEIAPP
jgi:hypothetical protein